MGAANNRPLFSMAFKKDIKPLHAYICTPAYNGQVDDAYAQSLAETSFCCPMYNIQVTAGIIGNVGFIELARNIFVKKFLEEHTDCTHLFFIDGDLQFESRAFVGLMRSGLPICAGLYRRRQAHEDYPFMPAENPDGGGLWFINDWLQCRRVPTGFLCISRPVLEAMAEEAPVLEVADQPGGVPWVFDLKKEPVTKSDKHIAKTYGESRRLRADGKEVAGGFRLIGEDYTFCDKYVEKYGQNVPVWSNFEFKHHGFQGNFWTYLNRMKDSGEMVKTTDANTREDCNIDKSAA
jgi:hypothetical protein